MSLAFSVSFIDETELGKLTRLRLEQVSIRFVGDDLGTYENTWALLRPEIESNSHSIHLEGWEWPLFE